MLRERRRTAGPRTSETSLHRDGQPRRRRFVELDLDLAEPPHDRPAAPDGDIVIGELRELLAAGTDQSHGATQGTDLGHGRERRCSSEGPHQILRGRGHRPRIIAGEHELLSHQGVAFAAVRELHGPTVVVAVPEARAPPRQPEVGGVQVHGLEPPIFIGLRGHARKEPQERREREPRRDHQLQLTLDVHGNARSSARRWNSTWDSNRPAGTRLQPSGRRSHANTSSRRFTSMISSSRSLSAGSTTSATHSTRSIQVPRHQVRRPDEVPGIVALAEPEDARVFEEAADDRSDADSFGQTGDPGLQAADPPDDQVDVAPRLRRLVERVDHAGVDQGIHLERELAAGARLLVDHREDARPQGQRRDEDGPVRLLLRVPGEVVEEVGDVGGEVGVGGQEPEVLVQTSRAGMVIPRADVAVAGDVIALIADHERELRVRLEPDHAVHHVDPGLLEHTRPRDVRFLVEARGELHESHHLFPALRGPDERSHDRRVLARGPVQRLLDRQHLWVAGSLLHEQLHRGVERVVRMLDHHIALPQDGEDVGPSGDRRLEPALDAARPRLVLQLRTVERRQLEEIRQAERRPGHVDVGDADVQLFHQELAHRARHGPGDLETHRLRRPFALAKDRLDLLEQVLGLVDLELDIRVARDAERVRRDDRHAREQRLDVSGDDLLDRHEPLAVGQTEEPGQRRRHLDAREPGDVRLGITHPDGQVQGEVRDVGERMRRIDRQWREDRVDALVVGAAQMQTSDLIEVLPAHHPDPRVREPLPQGPGPHMVLAHHEVADALGDPIELLDR